MTDGIVEKIVAGALRGIAGLVVTGAGYQLFDGRWYGESIFDAYLEREALSLLARPQTAELFSQFASESVPLSLRQSGGWSMVVLLALGLALVAHVLRKPGVDALYAQLSAPPPAGAPVRFRKLRSVARRVCADYVGLYPVVTPALFLGLTILFFQWPFSHSLAIVFLLTAIPMGLYLLLYPADITRGSFRDRFTYIMLLVLLVAVLWQWPQLYGSTVFDPDFQIASPLENADQCGDQLLRGPLFIAYESEARYTLFRVCFDQAEGRRYLDFFTVTNQRVPRVGIARLSDVLRNQVND